jgi:16S rRNA (uracil1498-N3)-methyltransferase
MSRFLLLPDAWNDAPALTGDEARHASQVLRMRAGDPLVVFDGQGRRAAAEILSVSRDRVPLKLGAVMPSRPPQPVITLAQAIPKGKNMDLIVQKAVELGVAIIQPLVTRHTIIQPGDGKSAKWRRNALEACKQCGQDTLPDIPEPTSFADWLPTQTAVPGLKLIASLAAGAHPLRKILKNHPDPTAVTLLIGPEGDFSSEETAASLTAGFLPVSLGDIVLRVETATLFCLSALRYEFGSAATP